MKATLLSALLLFSLICKAAPPHQLSADQKAQLRKLIEERDAAEALMKQKQAAIEALSKGEDPNAEPAEPPPRDAAGKFYDMLTDDLNLTIRRTLRDGKERELPATLNFTSPSNAADTWAADIGMSMSSVVPGRAMDWGVHGEYHYNELLAAQVDSFFGGFDLAGSLGNMTGWGAAWKLDASFRRDNLIAGEGALVGLQFYPVIEPLRIGSFMIGRNDGLLKGRIAPMVGVEWENGNGASAAFAAGSRVSVRGALELTGWLFPRYFGERIEATTSLSWWNHVGSNGFYDGYDANQLHLVTSLTYWLNMRNKDGEFVRHFGLNARYVNGNNPVEGAFDQNYWMLGFSVRF